MKYTLYMLRDDHPNRFMGSAWAHNHGGINLEDYQAVYSGNVEEKRFVVDMLEEIYAMFNLNHPADYTGRSMSVSDLVELEGKGIFFCDSVGFKEIRRPM